MSSGLLDVLAHRMSYLNQKQAVLAENVANVSTPGYKQLDVKPFSFGDALGQAKGRQTDIGMSVTDANHIVPASMAGVNAKTYRSKDTAVSLTGNSVDIQQQMMEVSKTSVDYQTTASLYHKMMGLFKIALKGNA